MDTVTTPPLCTPHGTVPPFESPVPTMASNMPVNTDLFNLNTFSSALSLAKEVETPARTPSPPHLIPFKRHTPFSAPWITACLRDDPKRAIPLLRNWSHSKRFREINTTTVGEINALSEDDALAAVMELKKPRVFVRGTRGSKLSLKANIRTLDTQEEHVADVLLDSGCEGSCIDIKYVCEHGLNTTRLPCPIPVYNADGQLNADGPIMEAIVLELRIGDHIE